MTDRAFTRRSAPCLAAGVAELLAAMEKGQRHGLD